MQHDYVENVKFDTDNVLSSLNKMMWSSIEEYAKTYYYRDMKKD